MADSRDSMLALVGGWIAPIFEPLGFGDWRLSTALITGFTAKESVVSTMTVLMGGSTAPSEDIVHTVHSHRVPGVHTALYSLV